MSHLNRWHAAIPLILLLGAWWIWISRPSVEVSTLGRPRAAMRHPAPDFTLPRYSADAAVGEAFTLSAEQGRPVVLNFWATWCGPCRREFPALQAAAARAGACAAESEKTKVEAGDGDAGADSDCVLIVGVNQGEGAATVERFLAEIGRESGRSTVTTEGQAGASALMIVLDTELKVGRRYNVQGLPLTYFIDADGIIRSVWSGEMNSVILAENIAGLGQ